MNKGFVVILPFLLLSFLGYSFMRGANSITSDMLPYMCSFEDGEDMDLWTFNYTSQYLQYQNPNRWIVGESVSYLGKKSLYVSNDDEHNYYSSYNNVIISGLSVKLEAGMYDFSFEWSGSGNGENGYLLVVFHLATNVQSKSDYVVPQWVEDADKLMGGAAMLTRSVSPGEWQHVQSTFRISGMSVLNEEAKIYFIWVNTDTDDGESHTSIAVDNIQLARHLDDKLPSDLHISSGRDNNVFLCWSGSYEGYEILYRQKGSAEFLSAYSADTTLGLSDIEYGAYEFWIRGIKHGHRSVYSIFPSVILYMTDCFDALNMYGVSFETGGWSTTAGKRNRQYQRVDFGSSSILSRHTVHYDTNEIDPRTIVMDGMDTIAYLKAVPDGEFGSIRLGNWRGGAEYESMTFHYFVESDANGVLLINYAQVFQDGGHLSSEQPRFTIEIKDGEGNDIDKTCGYVDIHAPTSAEVADSVYLSQWHKSTLPNGAYWQDWQTMGLKLDDYRGQSLTITFSTYDCSETEHYGYTYFTIQCTRSDIEGLPWGEGSTTGGFAAPKGFLYAWFNRNDVSQLDTLSTDRFLPVAENDTNTYICKLTYKTMPQCGFVYEASAKTYLPKAEIDIRWAPKNCNNGVVVYNRSHTHLLNSITGAIEKRYDMFSDITEMTCINRFDDTLFNNIQYPEEGYFLPISSSGDTLHVKIITGSAYNMIWYYDTAEYHYVVPSTLPIETHLYDTLCAGEVVEFPLVTHIFRSRSGTYFDSLHSSRTGCDSTVIFHLTVLDSISTEIEDTICDNETYTFHGRVLNTEGVYHEVLTSSPYGCDSLVTLNLHRVVSPTFYIEEEVCLENFIRIKVQNVFDFDSFRVTIYPYLDTTIYLLYADSLLLIRNGRFLPGTYYKANIRSYIPKCGTRLDSLDFFVNLPSTFVYTHYEDVMAIISEKYNGGFRFQKYQWYMNGQAIPGATLSYYYNPGLDKSAQYSLRVTLFDGREMWVCPFYFDDRRYSEKYTAPLLTQQKKLLDRGHLYIQRNCKLYNVLGSRVGTDSE